jgi:hypothetical protein
VKVVPGLDGLIPPAFGGEVPPTPGFCGSGQQVLVPGRQRLGVVLVLLGARDVAVGDRCGFVAVHSELEVVVVVDVIAVVPILVGFCCGYGCGTGRLVSRAGTARR